MSIPLSSLPVTTSIGNTDIMHLRDSAGNDFQISKINLFSIDQNVEFSVARTALHSTTLADWAWFSHYDQRATLSHFALIHSADGLNTVLNVNTGGNIYHRVNNLTIMKMNAVGLMIGGSGDPVTLLEVSKITTGESNLIRLHNNEASAGSAVSMDFRVLDQSARIKAIRTGMNVGLDLAFMVTPSGASTPWAPTEAMRITESHAVGIGTTTIPHGGIGLAKFAIDGTVSSTAGPHVQYTVSTDDYPVFQQLNWSHDNIGLNFDAYFDGAWRSSDPGSSFKIYKHNDELSIKYGIAAAGAAVSWNNGIILDATGQVGIGITPSQKFEVNGVGMFGVKNVSEVLLGMSVNTAGHEGIGIYHDGTEAYIEVVDSAVAWQNLTITANALSINSTGGNVSINTTGGNVHLSGGISFDAGTNNLKQKIIDIGVWDMDATAILNVAHGLTIANIRNVIVQIRNDATTAMYYLPSQLSGASGTVQIRTTDIFLERLTGGYFDTTAFNDAVMNRGYITIWYTV